MAYCFFQLVVVYSFSEIESTFPVLFLKLCDRLLIAQWHGFHYLFDTTDSSTKDFSLICLFFFYICCNLSAVQKNSAKTTNFSILNVFLRFLHQFVRKHFRIFVTVMRSKFHFLLKFSTRGT